MICLLLLHIYADHPCNTAVIIYSIYDQDKYHVIYAIPCGFIRLSYSIPNVVQWVCMQQHEDLYNQPQILPDHFRLEADNIYNTKF